jgi:outer membrane protein assembly factor BamB
MKSIRSECIPAALAFCIAALVTSFPVHADDWPTWRYDAARSAASPGQLAPELHLQWRRDNPPLVPAWSEDPRLHFDAAYQPVVMSGTMFVSSSHNDSVTAYDTQTGREQWRFYAGMPVRFAPVAANGRVYFGADDGIFYCLDAPTGSVVWTFHAAPNDRKVIGNGRLISVWPVRGGPLLADGKIHFTAGVWPFEGTFLYTLDAATGHVVSMTPASDSSAAKSAGPMILKDRTPEGYLAATGERLFIPCGRTAVTCLDRQSGKFIGFSYSTSRATNYHVSVVDRWLFHGAVNYDMQAKKTASLSLRAPVLTNDMLYGAVKGQVVAFDLDDPKVVKSKDRRGRPVTTSTPRQLWTLAADKIRQLPEKDRDKWIATNPIFVDIRAGQRLYGHHSKTLFAVDLPTDTSGAKISWNGNVDATPASMLAADGKLFVVTDRGSIHCFGPDKTEPEIYSVKKSPPPVNPDAWTKRAADLLERSGVKNAYCLVAGVGSGRLIEEIAHQSDLQIIGVDPDATKISNLRRRFDAQGLYGTRVELLVGDPLDCGLPPYLASLIVSEDLAAAGFANGQSFAKSIFHVLRPYGGAAYLALPADDHEPFAKLVAASDLDGAGVTRQGRFTLLSRNGALPGSADWTHEWGDPSNSLVSRDELVKAPLGVLWFGGPASSGELFYNRHYWGPSMAVVGGRMFIQGPGKLTAVDVYTGRILWKLPLDHNEDYNPGRRGNDFEDHLAGFHFLAVEDAVYLVLGRDVLRIDPVDGKIVSKFTTPSPSDDWGRIRVQEDLLLAPICRDYQAGGKSHGKLPVELVAMNRHTGEKLWAHKAYMSFPVLSVGADKIFCYDGLLEDFYGDKRRKGLVPKSSDVKFIKALDIKTGQELWKRMTDLAATWTGYSRRQDILMISNKAGMVAIRGQDGTELWRKEAEGQGFRGHPESVWDKIIVTDDRIIDQRGPGFAYELATGNPVLRKHPLTNQPVEWQFTKAGHHCNYAVASPHLLTFRAAEAGFCDLASGNTSRLQGFRSGCRNSLIPANGVLNSPNMSHACVCGFPIFTSLALVHQPENEIWSYSPLTLTKEQRVERVGINFGAPGDRLAANGTLWLDYPNVGGSSPAIGLKLTGPEQRLFQTHSAMIAKDDLDWVAASGVEGASNITVTLNANSANGGDREYTVRLVFAEPYDVKPDQRVFDVSLQGKKVLSNLDVAREAGGPRKVLVREFSGVRANKDLSIDLKATTDKTIIAGVEIVADAPAPNIGASE